MDVDVDLARIAVDEQRHHRVAVGRQKVHIRCAERAGERLVAHRPAVDEDELLERVRAAEGREPDAASEADAFARRLERQGIDGEVIAQRLAQPLGAACLSLP